MAVKYFVPKEGLKKEGNDWAVNIVYTLTSGNQSTLQGTLKAEEIAKQTGVTEAEQIQALLKKIGLDYETRDIAENTPPTPETLLDNKTITI